MRVEIRADSVGEYVVLDGYVNAVGRDSKVLKDDTRGEYVEQIMPGVFTAAISRASKIDVLLNHDGAQKITDTTDESVRLFEDNIGLRFVGVVRNPDIVTKARENRLVGWSFGFYNATDRMEYRDGKCQRRLIEALELDEVSLLDDTRSPAYYGTSIEVREDKNISIETRILEAEVVSEDLTAEIEELYDEEKKQMEEKEKMLYAIRELIGMEKE